MVAGWLKGMAPALMLIGCRSFILDLRRSDSVNIQGARGLLSLRSEVSRCGGRVRVVVTEGSRVERRLRLLEFDALFGISHASEEARMEAPGSSAAEVATLEPSRHSGGNNFAFADGDVE